MNPIQAPIPSTAGIRADAERSCVCCGSTALTDFFSVDRLPVHVGLLHDSRESARNAPMGEVTLSYCHGCGLIQNRCFDPSITDFAPGYEVALHHSKVFREFTEGVARRLVAEYELRNKTIFEIGCGAGFFLRTLCQLGDNDGIGVDPTVSQERTEQLSNSSVRFIRDFYTDRFVDQDCDFICCLSVFEDIPDPVSFLQRVRQMIGQRHDVAVYFEVFNAVGSFERLETWSVHYEQCNYLSLESLTNLFRRCGFEVLQSGTCYEGDQYLYVEAKAAREAESNAETDAPTFQLPKSISKFAQHYREAVATWTTRLDEFRKTGNRVVLWGSGGKGISFLNALDAGDLIQYVVEINPDKHGKFIPGTAQQIVPPEFLKEYQPDKVIITNPLYEREMKQQAAEFGVQADFLIA